MSPKSRSAPHRRDASQRRPLELIEQPFEDAPLIGRRSGLLARFLASRKPSSFRMLADMLS